MSYYPKKMVNINLYTSGNEYVNSTNGQPYSGPYHQMYDGSVYSGIDPTDPNRNPLDVSRSSIVQTNQVLPIRNNLDYSQLNRTNQELYEYGKDPDYFVVQPTGDDYKRGTITRYFSRRKNQTPPEIREISKPTFDDISRQGREYNYALWDVISMFWKITGPLNDSKNKNGVLTAGIVNTNERLRASANQQMRGIKSYLNDLIQYSVKTDLEIISGQYTGGGDFTVRQNNSDFIGYYHIMADGTIMDGGTHEQTTNVIILAGNVLVQNQINTLVRIALGKLGSS